MVEILIPITMFIMFGTIAGLFFYFRFRTRSEMQQTVRAALEKGQELSPELVDRLGEPRRPANTDLRRGVISMALALACVGFGFFLRHTDEEVLQAMLAISMLPLFVSLAYLALWRLRQGEDAS